MVHASLFSGIGGPEVAAAMLGWENAFHCEINPFGRAVLEYWFPDSESYEDVTKTDFSKWRGKIDVLTAGIPCQPFSYAGKRGGADDERYLWPEAIRVINEIRPTWVIIENVVGITTMVEGGLLTDLGCDSSLFGEDDTLHRYEHRGTFTIERICHEFEESGYSVQPVLISAASVNAPHRRDRVFIIAHTENLQCDGGILGYKGEFGGEQMRESGDGDRKDDATNSEGRYGQAPELVKSGDYIQEQGKSGRSYSPDASHANIKGLQESEQSRGEKDKEKETRRVDDRTQRSRYNGPIADSFRKRLEAAIQRGCDDSQGREGERRYAFISSYDAWSEGAWWKYYPSVSPVHAGNDGIPIRMDGASIPFNKWRIESLKAYGNAIVPQVMYRIFQAIEKV